MALLTREEFLEKAVVPTERVLIPELGGEVIVRGLTARQRDAFEAGILKEGEGLSLDNVRARLVRLTVVDDAGQPIFTDQDIDQLGNLSGKIMDQIFEVAQRLSGLLPRDIDELRRNLEIGQSGVSASG